MGGFEHALRLGHPYLGCEHLLLALVRADHPAADVLREHGVTPERVAEQVDRLAGGGLFGDLDRNALAAVGVDVDAVRARMTESFGQEALNRASRAAHREPAVSRWDPRRKGGGGGAYRDGVSLPHGPGMTQCLHNARLEEQARHDAQIGVEHLALGLLSATEGLVPPILSALGVSAPALRAAITDRCRRAG